MNLGGSCGSRPFLPAGGQQVKNAISYAMRTLELILGLALLFIISLNFVNVVGRYVFNRSILGAEEVQVYIMVWMAFVGAGIVTWRNMHLRMDALSRLMPAGVRKFLLICEFILCLAVVGYTATQSWDYVSRMLMLGSTSDVAHVPMWMVHASVVTGLALLILMLLAVIFTGGEKPIDGEGGSAP